MPPPESGVSFMARLRERLRATPSKQRIVFPEGDDTRVQAAAGQLAGEGLLKPVLLVSSALEVSAGVEAVRPEESPQLGKYARLLWERRRSRGLSEMEAVEQAARPLYFAALMVEAGDAEGEVAGAVHATADAVQAIMHSIEMLPGRSLLSSAHLLAVQDRSYGCDGLLVFADAALVVRPTPIELAEIAIAAADVTRTVLETEPLVALLSFSTKGSARHKEVDRILEALRYIKARRPELQVDGELQADAALLLPAGRSKAPGSLVAGRANTLVFPDLNSANIGYKLVERLGGAALLAVILEGLSRPVNIVSKGCTSEDIVHTAILTATQAARAQRVGA